MTSSSRAARLVCPRLLVLLLLGTESEDKPGLLTQALMPLSQGPVLRKEQSRSSEEPTGAQLLHRCLP